MKFLMMIKHAESPRPITPPQSLMNDMEKLVTEGFTKGWLKDTGGLCRTSEALRIRSKGGKLTVIDGPFTESKEIVGGYAIIETGTREEGIELARRFMELHTRHIPDFECESEVRPVDDK